MKSSLEILNQYWSYTSFRSNQADIIESVISKQDTLALLPTGGGKSICFQVPAMMLEGFCIVVTPLIALMKDQVEQLKRRGIIAMSIHSGMSYKEVDIALDRCAYDKEVKFLYLAPERINSEMFLARASKFNVNLIAVDEAHCISQWGFDFRPAYLNIAQLRTLFPRIPIIALTASATSSVISDICRLLEFKNFQIFTNSFHRDNLSYSCLEEQRKEERLLRILTKISGSAIVYVRTRLRAKQIAGFLNQNNIKSAFYHAGMTQQERASVQDQWIKNQNRVIVATNAFGMGIDKPDVRLVVHIDIPFSIEAYYQEAGRAGRDGKKAYSVILYHPQEIEDAKFNIESNHPPLDTIQRVYQSIANYFKIAVGSSEFVSYDFKMEEFCNIYQYKPNQVYSVLKILEKENLLQLNHDFFAPSKIMFLIQSQNLYEYQLRNPVQDPLIKLLLRMYGGELFHNFLNISEKEIARQLNLTFVQVINILKAMANQGAIHYIEQKNLPQIIFLSPRKDALKLGINIAKIQLQKDKDLERLEGVKLYIINKKYCKSYMLCKYFDSTLNTEFQCGICDVCVETKKMKHPTWHEENKSKIFHIIAENKYSTEEILALFPSKLEKEVLSLLSLLRSEQLIQLGENNFWEIKY